MKICVCANGPETESQISAVFGRCSYFLIIDSETGKAKTVPNSALQAGQGAGVAASRIVVSEKAEAAICGNFGPNAFSVLQMAGVEIYPGVFGLTVAQAVEKYQKGELRKMEVFPVPGHFGLGRRKRRGFGPGPRRRGRGRG